jgi:hypothetical protein
MGADFCTQLDSVHVVCLSVVRCLIWRAWVKAFLLCLFVDTHFWMLPMQSFYEGHEQCDRGLDLLGFSTLA